MTIESIKFNLKQIFFKSTGNRPLEPRTLKLLQLKAHKTKCMSQGWLSFRFEYQALGVRNTQYRNFNQIQTTSYTRICGNRNNSSAVILGFQLSAF